MRNRRQGVEKPKNFKEAMKNLIYKLRGERKNIDNNIFTALNNINMNCILGYKKDGNYTSFLDEYEDTFKKNN